MTRGGADPPPGRVPFSRRAFLSPRVAWPCLVRRGRRDISSCRRSAGIASAGRRPPGDCRRAFLFSRSPGFSRPGLYQGRRRVIGVSAAGFAFSGPCAFRGLAWSRPCQLFPGLCWFPGPSPGLCAFFSHVSIFFVLSKLFIT